VQVKPLTLAFGDRSLVSVGRHEAIRFAERHGGHVAGAAVTLFARAADEELVERNPFRGLGRRGRGRRDDHPPTETEFGRLLDGCRALGGYAEQMRNLLLFAAYTGMRPGELFALEWRDVDLHRNRVHVRRRLYWGELDLPKSNMARVIALPPPARDRLLSQPTRGGELVFRSKTSRRLSQPTLSGYWSQVKAAAGLELDFYLCTKHYGAALLYRLGLSRRAIAAQMGWSEGAVDALLRVYGHADLVALQEVDALYESGRVVPLRAVDG
jgi:integrase